MFYVTIFLILFVRELMSLFLSIYTGILFIYYAQGQGLASKDLAVKICNTSIELAEGLFASAVLLLFWVLRFAHEQGQMGPSSQLLMASPRKER